MHEIWYHVSGHPNEWMSFSPTLVPDISCQASHPPQHYPNMVFLLTFGRASTFHSGCLLCTNSFHLTLSLTSPAGQPTFINIFLIPISPPWAAFLCRHLPYRIWAPISPTLGCPSWKTFSFLYSGSHTIYQIPTNPQQTPSSTLLLFFFVPRLL